MESTDKNSLVTVSVTAVTESIFTKTQTCRTTIFQ